MGNFEVEGGPQQLLRLYCCHMVGNYYYYCNYYCTGMRRKAQGCKEFHSHSYWEDEVSLLALAQADYIHIHKAKKKVSGEKQQHNLDSNLLDMGTLCTEHNCNYSLSSEHYCNSLDCIRMVFRSSRCKLVLQFPILERTHLGLAVQRQK